MSRFGANAMVQASFLTVDGSYSLDSRDIASANTLKNGVLTAGTSWSVTNEATLAVDKCTFAYVAGGASTLVQAQADLDVVAVGGRWYKLSYTVANKTGSPTATLTTSFASASVSLPLVSGVNTVYFKAKGTPTDFTISSTLAAGQAFSLDSLVLNKMNDVITCPKGLNKAYFFPLDSGVAAIEDQYKSIDVEDIYGNRFMITLKASECLDVQFAKIIINDKNLTGIVFKFCY